MQERVGGMGEPGRGPGKDDSVRALCVRHGNKPSALLEILHDLQEEQGHVPAEALPVIADALNLSRAEVHGVFTFYHDFRSTPAGRHVLKLCRAEACQSMGAEAMIAGITQSLDIALGETTADGRVTVEAVYCLGNCALAPAAMLDGELIGRADGAKITARLAGANTGST